MQVWWSSLEDSTELIFPVVCKQAVIPARRSPLSRRHHWLYWVSRITCLPFAFEPQYPVLQWTACMQTRKTLFLYLQEELSQSTDYCAGIRSNSEKDGREERQNTKHVCYVLQTKLKNLTDNIFLTFNKLINSFHMLNTHVRLQNKLVLLANLLCIARYYLQLQIQF